MDLHVDVIGRRPGKVSKQTATMARKWRPDADHQSFRSLHTPIAARVFPVHWDAN